MRCSGNPSPTFRETEEVEIKRAADKKNGRGGRRPGAGRPNQTLAALIEAGKFDWMNRRHRELLLHEDVEGDEELQRLQEVYRPYQRSGIRSSASWVARSFEDRVRELAKAR
jgi:hypothetical protein